MQLTNSGLGSWWVGVGNKGVIFHFLAFCLDFVGQKHLLRSLNFLTDQERASRYFLRWYWFNFQPPFVFRSRISYRPTCVETDRSVWGGLFQDIPWYFRKKISSDEAQYHPPFLIPWMSVRFVPLNLLQNNTMCLRWINRFAFCRNRPRGMWRFNLCPITFRKDRTIVSSRGNSKSG